MNLFTIIFDAVFPHVNFLNKVEWKKKLESRNVHVSFAIISAAVIVISKQ